MMVRRGSVSDIDWVLAQAKAFAEFYGSKIRLDHNQEYARHLIKDLIENHLLLIFEKDGTNMGFIAGLKTKHHFNPDIQVLCELLWWVPKEFRTSGVGKALLDEFVKYGKSECDWITFTMEDNTPASDRPLLDYGFVFKEKTYLLEV